jgi:multiple sugar transport system permease protein
MKRAHRQLLIRAGILLFTIVMALFFVTPLLWFVFAPLNPRASLAVTLPRELSFENFQLVFDNRRAMQALLQNSPIIGGGVMVGIALIAALTAYGLSRSDIPGRSYFTYTLMLFSSVVTGTASMVPIFLLIRTLGLLDTHLGVILVLIGGLLPSATFMMRDFVEGVPRSYEEAAMVCGASPSRVFREIAFPLFRPGVMVVAIWAFVNGWGSFLTPFILLRSPEKIPASVAFYSFYDVETGIPRVTLIAAYAILYAAPVVLLYLLVNWRYGFRFFGGIKR